MYPQRLDVLLYAYLTKIQLFVLDVVISKLLSLMRKLVIVCLLPVITKELMPKSVDMVVF